MRPDGTAFGVFADTTYRCRMDLRGGILFAAEGPAFPVYVIERRSPEEVLKGLAELTGTMELPPMWALGYHQCRWSYMSADEGLEIARGFREHKIPCDTIWFDIDYMDGFRVFTFDKGRFADPKALNAGLAGLGFHSVYMIDPGVKAEPGYPVYDSGLAGDLFVKNAEGGVQHGKVWPGDTVFPDFTRPETRAWWAGLYGPLHGDGRLGNLERHERALELRRPERGHPPERRAPRGGWAVLPRRSRALPQRLRALHGSGEPRRPPRREPRQAALSSSPARATSGTSASPRPGRATTARPGRACTTGSPW